MQEQAERQQAKLTRRRADSKAGEPADEKAAQDAWTDAAHWWQAYLAEYPSAPAAAEARRHLARVRAALGQREQAIALLKDLSGEMAGLEKTARLYEAQALSAKE